MHLSQNFTLREAMRSQIAARHGIDNTPPEEVVPALRATAGAVLQPVRDHFGIPFSPSSWYRCLALNRRLGSRDTSQHLTGQAVDFELPGIPNIDLAEWVREHCTFDQLILEFAEEDDPAAGWVHASYRADGRNRGEVLTILRGGDIRIGLGGRP